jgi:hypothetical protein
LNFCQIFTTWSPTKKLEIFVFFSVIWRKENVIFFEKIPQIFKTKKLEK